MTLNREIWLNWKTKKPCPTCNIGTLDIPSVGVIKNETVASKKRNSDDEGRNYSDYIFTVHLKCNNCSESVAVLGYLQEEEYPSGIQKTIIPLVYYPAPKIIHIPISCPESVKLILDESFLLYWTDISSCANKIRVSIEVLLNEFKIPLQNDKSALTLDSRIKEFEKIKPDESKFLMAIKWLGNDGSHFLGIKKESVLDAFELLEIALEKLYNDREQKLIKMSEEIIESKKQKRS